MGGLQSRDDGGGVDIVGGASTGKVVGGFRESLQEWPESHGAAQALHQLHGDVAGRDVGKDQGVGASGDGRSGCFGSADCIDEGCVGLQFAIDYQIGSALAKNAQGCCDFIDGGMTGAAFG